MITLENKIMDKISNRWRDTGVKPTNLIVDIGTWYKIRKEFNPIEGKLIPAEYSRDAKVDRLLGLIVSILSNSNIDTEYMEVL